MQTSVWTVNLSNIGCVRNNLFYIIWKFNIIMKRENFEYTVI